MGRAAEVSHQVALDLRARLPLRDPAGRRADAPGPGRDAAGPHADRLVPRVPLARPDEAALPADRRPQQRPGLRPRGADARDARHRRAARRRADRRRRGPRRALLLRLPGPHRGARGRDAAAARGRGAVRQPRPARGARRRELDAHHLAGRRPPRRRPVADLPGDHQARALRGPRDAGRDGRRAPQARRARGPRRPLRRPRVAGLPRAAAPGPRQDRHRADRRHPALPGPSQPRQGARRVRARVRREGRRRGRRARRRVPRDVRARRRSRPGLLLRAADRAPDGGRHPPRAPQRVLRPVSAVG